MTRPTINGDSSKSLKCAFVCLLGGLALALLPASLQSTLKDVVQVAFKPGQTAATSLASNVKKTLSTSSNEQLANAQAEIDRLKRELAEAQQRSQRHRLAALHLKQHADDLRKHGSSPFRAENAQPLIVNQAVDARIIGEQTISLWRAKKILDAGSKTGISEDQWVLASSKLKIDQGQDSGVLGGLPVFSGRNIVGRVAESGRWTSSLELITAESFRAKAVLGKDISASRQTANESRQSLAITTSEVMEFSSEFLLTGSGGNRCWLKQVPITEAVQVGAAVYSVPGDRTIDSAMLFGFIESAERVTGALHWKIVVRPAADFTDLQTVQVVTTTLNPDRFVGRR